ncbi:MAG TPA: ATP-binding protein, partial [Polyangiaceae bacterium]|nr:ATP-binding protein [Polyangiaceae bacterium]
SKHSMEFAMAFRLGWDQVIDGILPLEVAIEQLPQQLSVGPRVFSCRFLPLYREQEFDGALLVIADITEKLAKEREEAEQNELMQGFKRLMLDRSGFFAFHREATTMLETIAAAGSLDTVSLKRTLHTLKGNSAVMGLVVVARLCHQLEDQLEEDGELSRETVDDLMQRWTTITEHVSSFAGLDKPRVIEVPQSDYAAMVSRLSADPAASDVLNQLLQWQLEPIDRAFERLAEQGRALAKRLGKGELSVVVEGNGIRLDAEAWTPLFSSLVHMVRNAIDHGIESAAERANANKPANGTLYLRAEAGADWLSLEIADDGRGIDWDAVAAKARERGLPHHTKKDLGNVLLTDGFTMAKAVTDTSGRGVGLSAVKQRVEAMNGTLDVRSTNGKGTTWVIRFPWSPNAVPATRLRRSVHPTLQRVSRPSAVKS